MLKKFRAGRIAVLCLTFMLILSGCTGQAAEADAPVTLGTAVEVQQLERSEIKNELTYIGQVEAQVEMSVGSKISAEVHEVYFDIGDTVRAGDVLFTVDGKDIQDQIRTMEMSAALGEISVKQAEYSLKLAKEESAQETLNELQYLTAIYNARYGVQGSDLEKDTYEDRIDLAEDSVGYTQSALQIAEGKLEDLEADLEQLEEELSGLDPVTQQADIASTKTLISEKEKEIRNQARAVAEAETNYSAAQSAVDSAKLQYDGSRITNRQSDKSLDLAYENYDAYKELSKEAKAQAITLAQFGVETAMASRDATQVQLDILQSNMDNAQIVSPISGVVSQRSVDAGQMISAAAAPFTIVQMDMVNVKVDVSETLINSIHTGDEVRVTIQAVGSEPLTGTVTAVSPAAGANSTYPVRIQLDNADSVIKPGMFSQVSFVQAQKDNTFVVDKGVILSDETTSFVFIIENGAAKKVIITKGLSNGSEVEITSGVSAGDEIVVVGQEYLRDGEQVNIVKRNSEVVVSPQEVTDSDGEALQVGADEQAEPSAA